MNVIFRRTLSGLSNQHLFHNVDVVVFVEGGDESYSLEEVYSGNYSHETEDIIFWRNIFEHFSDDKSYKFKSVGSKPTIKAIANDIVTDNMTSIYVAMDQDFDKVHKKQLLHKNVFYTYGYSWENDIWSHGVIEDLVQQLTAIDITSSVIEANFSGLIRDLKLAVYADGYLFSKGQSFFPRSGGILFCVDCATEELPTIQKDKINSRIVSKNLKKANLYSYGRRHALNVKQHCFGHLIAGYCCQLVRKYLKANHSLTGLTNKIIYRMGLNTFFKNHFESTTDVYNHYNTAFS